MRGLVALLFAMVVSPEWLTQNLRRTTVVHVGTAESFAKAHIRGAHFVDVAKIVVNRAGRTDELPQIDQLQKTMEDLGIGRGGRIVIYGDDSAFAARLFWTLDYLGQGKRIAILDGGLAQWTGPIASGAVDHEPKPFTARIELERLVLATQLRARKAATIIDVRSAEDFAAGHIEGAINIPVETPIDELRARMPAPPPAHVVVYDNTGLAASRTYVALRNLGYNPALYDGGWEEWRDLPPAPQASPPR